MALDRSKPLLDEPPKIRRPVIPSEIAAKLSEFCSASKTGNLTLDIVNGSVIGFKLTETGRVDRAK